MKKRARECPKADIELFSDLYSKEYAESAEEHVFHKILQKEKVGYGWTILDALYEENELVRSNYHGLLSGEKTKRCG